MRTGTFTVRRGDEEHRVTVSATGEARVDDATPLTVTAEGPSAYRVLEGGLARHSPQGEGELARHSPQGEGELARHSPQGEGEPARQAMVVATGSLRQVFVDGEVYEFTVDAGAAPRPQGARHTQDAVTAPMPAKVTVILVEPGQHVGKGDVLLKLEAMKMELPVRAPHEGTVKAVLCRAGELVQPGVVLVELA